MFWLIVIYRDLRKTAFKVLNFNLQSPQIQQDVKFVFSYDWGVFANVSKHMLLFTIFEWFRVFF